MPIPEGSVCETCGAGIHESVEGVDEGEPGRISCDGCNRPTSACTCSAYTPPGGPRR